MTLYLVRHPPVTKAWQTRCYGQSDPGLSRAGQAMVGPLVDQLAALKPDVIIHSDMVRTRAVAEPLARRLDLNCIPDPQWRERHFGTWEGKSWNAIYRESGNAMDGMVDDPNGFQPGGGETTAAMAMRVQRAMTALATDAHIVVIAHGGPIASAIAIRTGVALEQLAALIPAPGAITSL